MFVLTKVAPMLSLLREEERAQLRRLIVRIPWHISISDALLPNVDVQAVLFVLTTIFESVSFKDLAFHSKFPQSFLNLFCSIPDRISNACGKTAREIPRAFKPKYFWRKVLNDIFDQDPNSQVSADQIAKILSKGVLSGSQFWLAAYLVEKSIDIAWLIPNMNQVAIPSLVESLVALCSRSRSVSLFKIVGRSKEIEETIYPRLLVFHRDSLSWNQSLLENICCEGEFAISFCQRLCTLWSDPIVSSRLSIVEHKIIANSLKTLLGIYPSSRINEIAVQVSQGITSRMSTDIKELRRYCMKVAAVYSSKYELEEGLNFVKSFEELGESSDDDEFIVTKSRSLMEDSEPEDGNILYEENPDAEWNVEVEDSKCFDALEGVGLEHPDKNPKSIPLPIYPLDAIEYFRRGRKNDSDRKYIKAALEALADEKRVQEMLCFADERLSVEIARQVIALHDNENLESRHKALHHLCCSTPIAITGFLGEKLGSESLTTADRVLLLHVLRDSANSLDHESPSSSSNSKSRLPCLQSSKIQSASNKLCKQMEIWSSRGKHTVSFDKLKLQPFGSLCGNFFFPIVNYLVESGKGVTEPIVLSNCLFVLGFVFGKSIASFASSTLVKRMASDLLTLAWNARLSDNVR
jgi:hypothetical protein